MSTLNLYLVAVAIWGSTWMAIKFQLGDVAPQASVFYRFLVASVLLFVFCKWRGLSLAFTRRQHGLIAVQGMLMFSVSYIMVYHAELYIVSGLVAVASSASPLLNMLGVRVAYGTPFSLRVALGALLGIAGIVLVFWPEVATLSSGSNVVRGVSYSALAVLTSALASTLVARNGHNGLPVWQSMAFGMLYGAACSLVITLVSGETLGFAWTLPYVGSLLYLAVFGSVLAFGAYYTLLGRIGAGRAGYIGVMVPVIALFVSALFEDYRWQLATWLGVGFSLTGNLIVMWRQPSNPAMKGR
ncbi:MAG: EamA family transporter [Pseudomonadota bacterium]